MDKLKISSLLLGAFLMPVVSYGSADFSGGADGQFAGVVVSDEALFSAIRAGNFDLVNYLLDHGANVNALKKDVTQDWTFENTPLTKAIGTKNIDMVRLLLDYGADVNVYLKDTKNDPQEQWHYYYATPLTVAIAKKNIDMIRLLLDQGADINARRKRTEQNDNVKQFSECNGIFIRYSCPLVDAIAEKNIEIVRFLLERGANVNTEGGATYVPLIEAVNTGNLDMVRLLLEQKGIDIHATHYVTPKLTWDDYEAIGYGGGTYEDFNRQESITALQSAGNNAQIVQLLRAHGAKW